ncbi:MAG: HNH endonuclease signature motif containing protein [Patescibacteria group bacterium]
MNRWNIPRWLEDEVRARDKRCVYCGTPFGIDYTSKPTWEHIINNAKIITNNNIALCCWSCNASKGSKELSYWLESSYCKKKNINRKTVADIIKKALIHLRIKIS